MTSIIVEYPPRGINHTYSRGRGGVYVVPEMAAWKLRTQWALRTEIGDNECVERGAVELMISIYQPTKRGDIDGRIKAIQDALEGYAYANDAQITRLTVEKFVDRVNPRVELSWFKR